MKEYRLGGGGSVRPPRVDYEAELNPQQLAVVRAGDGPNLVIAGAGSGKTHTLTYRVARLIESGTVAEQIMLVTFTNKAAREMLRRVESLLRTDVRRILGGTFHHAGNMILRRYAKVLGYSPMFTILDREDAKDLMGMAIASVVEDGDRRYFPKADVLVEMHSMAINTRRPLAETITARFPSFVEITGEIGTVCAAYEKSKRVIDVLDFDDLLLGWHRLVTEFPDVRDEMRRRFRHILVDEYQDTNRLQSEIVEAIAGPGGNLMVVGDDAQSIYSFRGADFGNIIEFPKRFPSAKVLKLETNYRSTTQVLDLSNASIAHNRRRFEKSLRPHRAPGPMPEVVSAGDPTEQAQFVAQRVLELRDEGLELRDMAVLYRAHWHSMELQIELRSRGIPFEVRSGVSFFEQRHVKDVTAYLRLVANPRDGLAWRRVLRLCRGVGTKTTEIIYRAAASSGDPIAWVLSDQSAGTVPARAKASWQEFRALLRRLTALAVPSEAIRTVLEGGYESHLMATFPNGSARAEDIRRLADFALRFADIPAFLSELALVGNLVGADVSGKPEPEDVLVLSSVHQAKGLEWKAVFVIWLVESKFPDARAVAEQGDEEERRLFYVACTRAKDFLYLTLPDIANERGELAKIQKRSRFLMELPADVYETAIVEPCPDSADSVWEPLGDGNRSEAKK